MNRLSISSVMVAPSPLLGRWSDLCSFLYLVGTVLIVFRMRETIW
jgi:hypothetical protein